MIIYRSNIIKRIDGSQWRIDIDDVQYSSTVNTFQIADFQLKFEGDGSGMYENFIRGCSIDVNIEVNPSVDGYSSGIDSWLQSLIYADEQRFTILLYRYNTSIFALEGVYPVLQDLITLQDTFPYVFTLTGSDGLGRLKDIDFNPNALPLVDGKVRIGDVLRQCLSFTGVDLFYGITDTYIQAGINWFEISSSKTDTIFTNARIPLTCLFADPEKLTYKKAYDIVVAMLQPFGLQIKMCNGGWWISQPDTYSQITFKVYVYGNRPFSFGKVSSYDFTHKLIEDTDITYWTDKELWFWGDADTWTWGDADTWKWYSSSIANFKRQASGNMIMKPAMQYVHVNYKSTSKQLFAKTAYNTDNYSNGFTVKNLSTFSLDFKVHLTYQILKTTDLSSTPPTTQTGFARLEMQITFIDSSAVTWYLFMHTSNINDGLYWTNIPNGFSTLWFDIPKVSDARDSDVVDLSLVIPPVNDSSVTTLTIDYINCHEVDSTCGSLVNWSANFNLSQLNDAGTDNSDQQFQTVNPDYPFPKYITTVDLSTQFLNLIAHGFSNSNQLRIVSSGSTGLIQNSLLFVVNADANKFQLSLTSGGAYISLGGTPDLSPIVQLYDPSTNRLASVNQQFENLIGDDTVDFSDSGIEIYTGSAWQPSVTWNVGTVAVSGYPLGQLLSLRAMLMQKTPKMCYQGNFLYGYNLYPANTVYMLGKLFMFNASVYKTDTVQVEYIECALDSNDIGSATSTPLRHYSTIDPFVMGQIKKLNSIVGGLQYLTQGLQTELKGLDNAISNKQATLSIYTPNLPTTETEGEQVNLVMEFKDGQWGVSAAHS